MGKVKINFLILLFLTLIAQGQTKRVLFIGNSYTYTNNMPQITANIASSRGDQLVFAASAISGYSLKDHSSESATISLIRQGGWDYVVLQEYSRYPSEPIAVVQANVYPYARYLNDEINKYNSTAETMFYMTWGRRDGDAERCPTLPTVCTYTGMDDLTRERYMYMARENQAVVSPVGAVWRYIRDNYPSIELYEPDGSHPSPAGSYAAACCFYTAIFRKDPGLITYNYTINATDAGKIRNAVRSVVYNNLGTWYLGDNKKYTISVWQGSGGSINPSGNQTVNPGGNINFNFSPAPGYKILDVKVDNVSIGPVTSYTFSNVTDNHTISASFIQLTFSINSASGAGGNISPQGVITVTSGSNRTFTITANKGYRIDDIVVDNNSVGPVSSYTFYDVGSSHSIYAQFKPLKYTIESNAGQNGTISPSGKTETNYGTSMTYDIKADEGFQIGDVIVDNVSVGPVSSYTFYNVGSYHSIYAQFKPLTYTIESNAGQNGTISPSGKTETNYGTSMTYDITAYEGFQIGDVIVDNVSVGAVSKYTFKNVISSHTIYADFKPITFIVTGIAGSGGSISPSGQVKVNYGNDQHFSILPDNGYKVTSIMLDYLPVAFSPNDYSLSNVKQNHIFSVFFTKIRNFTIMAGAGKNGSISPSGEMTAAEGSEQHFTITPSPGYRISNVFIDTISIGPVSEFTFDNISSDHTISAIFTTSVKPEVFPNPFRYEFNLVIRSPDDYQCKINLVTMNHRIVFMETDIPTNTIVNLKPEIPPGLYILNVFKKGMRIASQRVIKY